MFSLSLCRVWGLAFTANRMTPCLKDTQVIHVHPIEYWFLLIFNDTQMIHPIELRALINRTSCYIVMLLYIAIVIYVIKFSFLLIDF